MKGLSKVVYHLSVAALLFLVTGCPGPQRVNKLTKIQENNMDLPELSLTYYKGVEFWLSDFFRKDYDESYVLTDEAMTRVIHEINVNFSVEIFDEGAAEVIQYTFDDDIELLDAVHDNYVLKREESLYEPSLAIKKELPSEVGFDGYVQVIHGSNSSYSERSSYFTATLKAGQNYYVFQLIGKEENMGYLYDDFMAILSSVQL